MINLLEVHTSQLKNMNLNDPKSQAGLDILLSVFNDWPEHKNNVNAYILDIEGFIGKEITMDSITQKLSEIRVTEYAWHSEALTQLLTLFNIYEDSKDTTLRSIIKQMSLVAK